ncbi:Ig-like domain-containing protein [uncultured Rhodococcus sp.]|uniref:beta strand repeat-containing protein n=1 Tax=uncultured Rhodococcus sp. TaxID=194249 RepID=UPI0028DC87E6|nr:Ig-like domain-containing protein [uncultured Rhodococcus sp.]
MKRSSAVVVAALVGGVLVAGGVASAAPTSSPPVENSIGFKLGCDGYEHLAVDIADVFHSTGVTVSAPEKVVAGSTFTYRVQPNVMSVPTGGHAGRSVGKWTRLKYDFDIPAGVSLVDAQVVAGTSSNLSGVTPSVIRINDGGSPDGAGTHLRISGNNQTADSNNKGGNGPSTSKNSDGGIEVGAGKTFRLPAIDVTVVAGAAGSTVQPKLRATDGDSGAFNSPKNAFTFLQYETLWPGYWERYNCSPRDSSGGGLNAGGQALATVNVVSQAATSTTVTSGAAATVGQSTDLVAQVSPAPTGGTVQFKDGGTDIGAPVAVVNGVATLPHTFTAAGDHSITAVYDGVLEFLTSTSPARTVSVAAADVQTTASLTVPSSAVEQTSVALTANISPAANGGTVQFKDGGIDIGGPIAVTGGAATLDHTFTTAGSHSITAVYSGTAGFGGSTAQAQTIEISSSSLSTTTTLQVPATAVTGTAVDLTATVAPSNAVGSVQFKSNGAAIGSPVTVAGGSAILSHAFSVAGAQSVTADFTAAAGFVSSSASARTVTVSDPAPVDVQTMTSLSVPATAVTGTVVDLTATVAPNNAVGSVQFKSNGTAIGSPVTVTGGVATLSHTFDTAGAQSVTADFTAAAGFVSSSASARTVTVSDPAPVDVQTMTSLSVPATAVTGTVVDLTATVAPNNAVGSVQFKSNGTAIGSPVTVSGGTATLSHSFDAAGAQSITADFTAGSGFKNSVASAKSVQVSVADQESVVELNIPTDAKTGVATDLWATVRTSSDDAVGVGTVQFYDGGVAIGGPEAVTAGAAGLTHSFTSAGAHSITAVYSGGAGVVGSSAQARTVNVTDPAPSDVTTETVVTAPADAVVNKSVTLSATVSSVQNGGTVQFMDGDTPIGDAVAVVNGIAALNHTFTTTGAHSISAIYSGAAGFTGSTSTAHAIQVKAATGGGTGSLGSGSAGSSDFLPFGS